MNKHNLRLFIAVLHLVLVCCYSITADAQKEDGNADSGNLKYVDPRIGNVGQLLEPTRPTVQLPHQLIRMYPQRNDYIDDQISSFPLTIVSHRLGQVFALKPSVKPLSIAAWDQKLTFDHDLEVTRPWYYSTYLVDDDMNVEFTPGKKTGIFRFAFPHNSANKSLLFNLYNDGVGSWHFTDNEMRGMETYHNDVKVYMYGVFSVAGKTGTVKAGKLDTNDSASGINVKAWISFPENSPDTIEFRYAISYISVEQAKENFDNEIKDKSFVSVKNNAEATWAKVINQITVIGGTEAQKRS